MNPIRLCVFLCCCSGHLQVARRLCYPRQTWVPGRSTPGASATRDLSSDIPAKAPINRVAGNPLPEERNVPTNVGCQPKQERQPPENQDAPHPNFVVCQPQTFWQKVRPGSKSDIQPPGFRKASERCVRCGQRVKRPVKLFRNLRLNTFVKGRNHGHRNQHAIKENDRGLTPGVCAIPFLARQDSSQQQAYSDDDLKQQHQVCRRRCCRSKESCAHGVAFLRNDRDSLRRQNIPPVYTPALSTGGRTSFRVLYLLYFIYFLYLHHSRYDFYRSNRPIHD